MSETFAEARSRGAALLEAAGAPGAMGDAARLLAWAAGWDAARLAAEVRAPVPADVAARYKEAIAARAARRPVSQIIGGRWFWGRWFEVTPDVLDPRPETETLVAAALDLPDWTRVLDLGVDVSAEALRVAASNLAEIGVAPRAELAQGHWLRGVAGPYDLVVANPPYIAEAEMAGLAPEVARYEPRIALTPGDDGLSPYREIAASLGAVLSPGGAALFEHGPGQAVAIEGIFLGAGFPYLRRLKDLDGRDRAVLVQN